jgi:mevalonate kinase
MIKPVKVRRNFLMSMSNADKKRFFGKVLLLGEYSIIQGGEALTLPFEKFSGQFEFPGKNGSSYPLDKKSNRILRDFLSHLRVPELRSKFYYPLDLEEFEKDLEKGMYFSSNIPQGYGVGSSGALVAALFYHYAQGSRLFLTPDEITFRNLREQLALMESWFHGSSSGLDPLTSLLGGPIRVHSEKKISFPDFPLFTDSFHYTPFLIDTGKPGNTRPLVDWYNRQVSSGQFNADLLKALSNQVLKAMYKKDRFFFESFLAQLSLFQLENMRPMIPDIIRSLWQQGIYSGEWLLKLCGSGGGGFVLGFTDHYEQVKKKIEDAGFKTTPISSSNR